MRTREEIEQELDDLDTESSIERVNRKQDIIIELLLELL